MGRATIDQSEDRSALHVPVGSKAALDSPEVQLPVYPRKRTQDGHLAMSVACRYCCKSLFRVKYENFKDR